MDFKGWHVQFLFNMSVKAIKQRYPLTNPQTELQITGRKYFNTSLNSHLLINFSTPSLPCSNLVNELGNIMLKQNKTNLFLHFFKHGLIYKMFVIFLKTKFMVIYLADAVIY